MMKLVTISLAIVLFSCADKENKRTGLNGIWIPQNVNWKDGNFDTYYFPDDTSVVIISSVQKKIGDSILFRTEPGFNIKKGVVEALPNGQFKISYKFIYRFVKLTTANADKVFEDTAKVMQPNQSLQINHILYQRANTYTKESRDAITAIATKMVPDIEQHPEKFN